MKPTLIVGADGAVHDTLHEPNLDALRVVVACEQHGLQVMTVSSPRTIRTGQPTEVRAWCPRCLDREQTDKNWSYPGHRIRLVLSLSVQALESEVAYEHP